MTLELHRPTDQWTPAPRAVALELSVVMPCLNEADTIGTCIRKAREAMDSGGINGEIILADNGSIDGSQEIARSLGARVIDVRERGYGSALMGGIRAADGQFILMGDADDSYDFTELPKFVQKLREGYDLVQGCRLPSGGGTVRPGAMPFLHRWWGNPMFSRMARTMFNVPIHDIYCGMRGFTRELYDRLDQRCTGMAFATEMILRATRIGANIAEVPITLHPDGRKSHPPHLKTFRDGWRTLRFFLMYSPRWLFLIPGQLLILLGILGYALAMPMQTIGGITFGLDTLMVASLAILCGSQSIQFAVFAKAFAVSEGLAPPHTALQRWLSVLTLEKGLIAGAIALLSGLGMLLFATNQWRLSSFGHLDYDTVMRWTIPGATLTAWGLQIILASFFVGILQMKRS